MERRIERSLVELRGSRFFKFFILMDLFTYTSENAIRYSSMKENNLKLQCCDLYGVRSWPSRCRDNTFFHHSIHTAKHRLQHHILNREQGNATPMWLTCDGNDVSCGATLLSASCATDCIPMPALVSHNSGSLRATQTLSLDVAKTWCTQLTQVIYLALPQTAKANTGAVIEASSCAQIQVWLYSPGQDPRAYRMSTA